MGGKGGGERGSRRGEREKEGREGGMEGLWRVAVVEAVNSQSRPSSDTDVTQSI